MTQIKFQVQQPMGDHVHIQVFAGEREFSRALCGRLTFRKEEVVALYDALDKSAIVWEGWIPSGVVR